MFTIAIHGGACSVTRSELTEEKEKQYREGLEEALTAGYNVLARGGSALDAVEQAVKSMEDNPLFNAGRGANLTSEEKVEMDAAIMCGKTLKAGAVANVRNIRNPIALARAILEKTENVLLDKDGAMAFARDHGIPFEPDEYFVTEHRFQMLQEAKEEEESNNVGKGTVGAVALDQEGNLAVATSTGGIANKKYGRVGDSPIIGGGTYANNRACAISCTGDGEYIMRAVAAHDVFCLMDYKGLSLREACEIVMKEKVKELGGGAGLIAIDRSGQVELVFNCESMLRAWRNERGEGEIAIL
ncbi:isoaspartyl peptidase/L-asparaginase family protein [Telluribacter sp. SYSU D00476]|uniref:isoaspartyl peptidase/L-asparaginase family protein n=1 Tax=Telluribacter sp. SYSU D00476 TaxID=2811430 RepID=UPI001FF2D751|nr:isoaspartyl peptidase/L-asparaginase [Telluribacter sp. SYSU D00476]